MKTKTVIILVGLLSSLFVSLFTTGIGVLLIPLFGYSIRYLENINRRPFNVEEFAFFGVPCLIYYLILLFL